MPVPAGAVGRPGLVAMLRRLRPDADGRMVAVIEPAGRLSVTVGAPRPVFCWRVRLLGAMPVVKGKPAREVHVPDRCLIPLAEMSPAEVASLIRDQRTADYAKAMHALRDALGAGATPLDEFERFVDRAGSLIGVERALEVVPAVRALEEIGFVRPTLDSTLRVWSAVHGGQELRFDAHPDPFGGWKLLATGHFSEKAICDERFLPPEWPRGEAFGLVLGMVRDAFGDRALTPDALNPAVTCEAHKRVRAACGSGLPTLRPDPVVFRAMRRWLVDCMPTSLPGGDDPWLHLRQDGNLLRMEAAGVAFGCPVHGLWADARRVRLCDFAAMPDGVPRGRRLVLVQDGDFVRVNDWKMSSMPLET
jgi:hypothetical protein